MLGVRSWAYIGLATAALGLVGYTLVLKSSNARLRAENTVLTNNLEVRDREIEQIKEAESVANAWAKKYQDKSDKYDALIEALISGDPNAILALSLPPYVRDAFDGLSRSE
jgi:Tfp pilus assembly protein PilN